MPGLTTLPPFPEDVPTHSLLVVDYHLIKEGDDAEIDKLWDAATKLGFWYLKNHDADAEVDAMFVMGEETMKLPLDEKMKYELGDGGNSFGYKAAGTNAIDEKGTPDTTEFLNVSKDDALAYPRKVHRDYPETVYAHIDDAVKPFMLKSIDICNILMSTLNNKLGLPKGRLHELHQLEKESHCQSRCIKKPPGKAVSADELALSAHTDYGSLSFLHNRLGGLQVMPPGDTSWYYIKPIPGHAICNVGDALAIMSGGILRSNVHRVITPPKEQAAYERWSLVYFHRPHDGVVLEALVNDSPMIADAVARAPNPAVFKTGETADAWMMRRVRMRRAKNMTGPEAWRQSLGTEHENVEAARPVSVSVY
ncbi:uncharacterized protein PHACADRAFT_254744 [Phanerochaete carnosa HHB-10118-sp]|uniref:Fe2OG dioxygenase domain-containing protein n=1 Tax=Phanerochaete carnosa (strain HHB-10118-sp) TaxID=650164 RepID=K5VZZ4_PHACS|nr:uncharacterized protein PHACADRAFT_254744 [Phanerochaete carnosa HHB-10118-sp]EKM57163.1 hypothetical protein PHACADRAFT_254744 [Phanerochaete carnosa HHB-10118-sp]